MKQIPVPLDQQLKYDRKSARKDFLLFKSLLKHPGWKRLEEILAIQIRQREVTVVYNTDKQIEETGVTTDWMRGEASALQLLMKFPKNIVEDAKITLETAEEQDDG